MLETLLAHFPNKFFPEDTKRPARLPDGMEVDFEIVAIRRGDQGSLSFVIVETPDGRISYHIQVISDMGAVALLVPPFDGAEDVDVDVDEAIAFALRNRELLEKVVARFPAIEAECLGAEGRRPSRTGL
jgi:hypothetical protein